jgi:lysophospholipase
MTLPLLVTACQKPPPAPPTVRIPASLSPRFYPPDGWTTTQLGLPGFAPVRYGVAAPTGVPRASVVIVADQGETAEVYFETARDLIAQGYAVWILDPAPTPAAGVAAIRAAVTGLVKPQPGDTVILAGGRDAALPALLAAETGGLPINGLALWSPVLSQASVGAASETAAKPAEPGAARGGLARAWQAANPMLRPPARSSAWLLAQGRAASAASDEVRLKALAVPVLLARERSDGRADAACRLIPHCERLILTSSAPAAPLAIDRVRSVWLDALRRFVENAIATRAHGV